MCQLKSHLSGLGVGQAKRTGRESLTLSTALSMLMSHSVLSYTFPPINLQRKPKKIGILIPT